ncbi:MAG: hypothetical protein AAF962_01585 [Actinomycetota bacterium]
MWVDEEHSDVIVESTSAPFRPPAPRVTQDLTPPRHAWWATLGDLAVRRRGHLALLFALLMAVTVALAFAARPDPRVGADVGSSEEGAPDATDGLAASIPPMPDDDAETEADAGLAPLDGPADPTGDESSTDEGTSTTATTTATSASTTTTTASTSASSASTAAPTTAAPVTTAAPTTTTAPSTTTEAPTTTFRSVNLLELSGFESPRLEERFAYVGVDGWSATGPVELWVDGYNGVPAYAGRQFTELNAQSAITISQEVDVSPGGVYTWTFAHRGRKDTDTVELTIDGAVIGRYSAGPDTWTVRSGEVTIPAGQTSAVIALRAVDEGGIGNFIDTFRFYRTG